MRFVAHLHQMFFFNHLLMGNVSATFCKPLVYRLIASLLCVAGAVSLSLSVMGFRPFISLAWRSVNVSFAVLCFC